MRALVVYESMFGNTRTVAAAIAEGLSGHVRTDLVEVGAAPREPDVRVDLLVVGGPTHAFGMSRPGTRADAAAKTAAPIVSSGIGMREWIEQLPPATQATAVATFDTRVRRPRVPGSAARAALKQLRRNGFRIAVPAVTFWVDGTTGPLVDGEVERARAWGDALGAAVYASSSPGG
jgi:flavorubredoxin